MNVTKHFYFYGLVQGVGFRYHVLSLAQKFGLSGYVRNLQDGSVEVLIEGDIRIIEKFLDKCHKNTFAKIEKITSDEIQNSFPKIEKNIFRIIY